MLVSWQFSGPYGVTKYGSGWRKDVVNQCLEFAVHLITLQYLSRLISLCPHHPHTRQRSALSHCSICPGWGHSVPTPLTRDKGPPCHTAVFVQAEVTLSPPPSHATKVRLVTPQYLSRLRSLCPHPPHTRQSVHSKNSQTAIFTNTFKNSYQHFYFFVYHQLSVGLSFWEANTVTYKYFLCITQNDCLSIYTFWHRGRDVEQSHHRQRRRRKRRRCT